MTGLYSIPLSLPFADVLAEGLLRRTRGDPTLLPRMTVLLPTARACRSLREAFLRRSDGPLLLPGMQALGDIDADELTLHGTLDAPPAIPALKRQVLLARSLMQSGYSEVPAQAAAAAASLARLLDEIQTEELPDNAFETLVPENYADHWQKILSFLSTIRHVWPGLLEGLGLSDPAVRRIAVFDAQIAHWQASPPASPVIVAGVNGSIRAVRRLMRQVSRMPEGEVILHGLDHELDEESWQGLEASHPQYVFRTLLDEFAISRDEVPCWPDTEGFARRIDMAAETLLREIVRPSQTVEAWQSLPCGLFDERLAHVTRLDAPTQRAEAEAIACLFREALETPGKRAALVTPDRELARLVAAACRRWKIEVDDSAGQKLSNTPPGGFLRLTGAMIEEDLSPLALLGCLKHPLALGGLPPGRFRRNARQLELAVLRGPAPEPGFEGLLKALAIAWLEDEPRAELTSWVMWLQTAAAAFHTALHGGAPVADILAAHAAFAEALATGENAAPGSALWKGQAGSVLGDFLNEAMPALAGFPPVPVHGYVSLIETLMAGFTVRDPVGAHPRLTILGTIEARLQQSELVVLGGLNEGTWPETALADPFLSRDMRAKAGLPLPEFRIGLAAHDFATCLCAPEVVLTRAIRVRGAPTVPSRWLLRLDAVLQAAKADAPHTATALDHAGLLDAPQHPPVAATRPMPRPPLAARPRRMSVSDVEAWLADPYRLYARKVLKLKPLDELAEEPGAADRGTIIHKVLEGFTTRHKDRPGLPNGALQELIAEGRREFDAMALSATLETFWWPRFERVARFFVDLEHERRQLGYKPVALETAAKHVLQTRGQPFTLTAKADRIDRTPDGGYEVIDYKTGSVPGKGEVIDGSRPQLSLEAAMIEAGGFADVVAGQVTLVSYWKLTGGAEPGKRNDFSEWPRDILERLIRRVELFDKFETPYCAIAPGSADERRGYQREYEQLERVREWIGGETSTFRKPLEKDVNDV